MNERIRELERQAEQFVMSIPASLDINEYTSVFNEKFAELIVRECIEVVDDMADPEDSDRYFWAIQAVSQNIKKHFGVEE